MITDPPVETQSQAAGKPWGRRVGKFSVEVLDPCRPGHYTPKIPLNKIRLNNLSIYQNMGEY